MGNPIAKESAFSKQLKPFCCLHLKKRVKMIMEESTRTSYVDVDRDLVLASFPDEVGAEIAL